MGMTRRQRDVFDFIISHTADNRISPTHQEIGDHCGISLSTVSGYITKIAEGGRIRRGGHNEVPPLEVLNPGGLAVPCEENGFTIPPDARYVPVASLPGLLSAWLRRRQSPDLAALGPPSPTGAP